MVSQNRYNDLLPRQTQWRSFGTSPMKNKSFEQEISKQWVFFIFVIISVSRICKFFGGGSCLSNKAFSYQWVASILKQF